MWDARRVARLTHRLLLAAAGFGFAATLSAPAVAQDAWPSKRITLIVPVGAGTITDAIGRVVADYLKDALSQAILVENRPGAGATLGARLVSRATPDGYTFLFGGNTTHSVAPSLFKNLPYDPVTDFTPVARIGRLGSFLATNPKQPFKTIQELVAFAKANPGKLTYGHGNAGGQIIGETIKKKLGLEIARLPYSSNTTAITDLLSNNIQLMVPDIMTGVALVESGEMVALAMGAKSRSPRLPAAPTLDETVLPGFDMAPWVGMFGPPGLPKPIVDQMSNALGKMQTDPAAVARLLGVGPDLYYLPGDQFAAFVRADVPLWAEHARIAGIEPQ